jgi:hypothetical protein
MGLPSLKLHLIQQIIATDDPAVLEKIRRILDEAEGNVVAEGEAPYFKLEDRMYTADEVRAMLNEVLSRAEEEEDYASHFTKEEWDEMDREQEQAQRGEGTFYTIEEVMEHMKKDLGK